MENGKQQLVIGIGSGRCGTRTLAALLDQQPSAMVGHETCSPLSWEVREQGREAITFFENMLHVVTDTMLVGDVASYYCMYIPFLMDRFSGLKVICLQRDRAETVESFRRWLHATRPGISVNHWSRKRYGFANDRWDECFPKFGTRNLRVGIGLYWDRYYSLVSNYMEEYPDRVCLIRTPSLNDPDALSNLLDWLEIPKGLQNLQTVHLHQSE